MLTLGELQRFTAQLDMQTGQAVIKLKIVKDEKVANLLKVVNLSNT